MSTLPVGSVVAPTPLVNAAGVHALLLNLAAGQSVAPCNMPMTVLYYVIEGRELLCMGDEQAELRSGSLTVVPAGVVRSISAAERMHVLAVQAL